MSAISSLASLFLLFIPLWAVAQNQGSIWVFGKGNMLDFSTSPPVTGSSALNLIDAEIEGSASISDSLGRLLFYSDGRRLWDWNNTVIVDTLRGHQSATHAAYIVPRPRHKSEYFLLTLDSHRNQLANGLRYSRVIACKDEGVTVGEVNVLLAENMTEKIVAVRHQNGEDYWLITHEFGSNQFRIFLVESDGIHLNSIQGEGLVHGMTPTDYPAAVGSIKANPQGSLIVVALSNQPGLNADILAFNKFSGVITHLTSFVADSVSDEPVGAYGASFSANGGRLYLTSPIDHRVMQYNSSLLPDSINAFLSSKQIVYSHFDNNETAPFLQIQLGPDEKIYMVNFSRYLGVIHNPDMEGVACNVEDSAIVLLNRAEYGLPSFIDSYDYNISGFCNPNGLEEAEKSIGLHLYPNPATHTVRLEVSCSTFNAQSLTITDMLGNTVMNLKPETLNLELDVSGLASGVYTVAAQLGGGEVLRARLVVGR